MLPTQANDLWMMAQTVWAEGQGEPVAGKIALAWTIINRCAPNGTIEYAAGSYHCWNDPILIRQMDKLHCGMQGFADVIELCSMCLGGSLDDPTNGATKYFDTKQTAKPSWYDPEKVTAIIGGHTFLKV